MRSRRPVMVQPTERSLRSLIVLTNTAAILGPLDVHEVVGQLLVALGDLRPSPVPRRRLRELLTGLGPGAIPPHAWPLLDALWATEARERPVTRARSLPRLARSGWAARVSVWRGDLTTLEADAIVDAANAGLTGCYRPLHGCVDNAIHTAAGPRLREECGRVMLQRGRPEPTGTATPTRGYFLPARTVLHTVGPTVHGPAPSPDDERTLRRCYAACLDAAEALPGVSSVAFPGISTGVFGYPAPDAARAAIATIREVLEGGSPLEHVVLVTFTESDQAAVSAAAEEACRA